MALNKTKINSTQPTTASVSALAKQLVASVISKQTNP